MTNLMRRVGVAACCFVAMGVRAQGAGEAGRIPEVHGISFAEQAVNLPEILKGKVGVLVVGFSHGSQDQVMGWGKRLAGDYRDSPTVVYYEMPVLASVPRMLRGFVEGKIKDSVPDAARARFVPLLENEAAWRTVAHYKGGDDAYVLVVDEHGVVRWETQGAATDASSGALKERVEALGAGMGQAGR